MENEHVYAMVSPQPVLPGRILLSFNILDVIVYAKSKTLHVKDLTDEETASFAIATREVGRIAQKLCSTKSSNIYTKVS